MNGTAILALCLGIISVIITLNYLKLYETLSLNVSKLANTCDNNVKNSNTLLDIQRKLDISDIDFERILLTNKKAILDILQKKNSPVKIETFVNYKYLNSNQRGIEDYPFSKYIDSPKLPRDPTYMSAKKEYDETLKYINSQVDKLPDYANNSIDLTDTKPLTYKKESAMDGLRYNFIKNNWCLVDYENKNYCFASDQCDIGKLVGSREECV
jgi:hypothetical protein